MPNQNQSLSKPSPNNNLAPPVRRITGSANIPITPAGEVQAREMAAKYSQKFGYVFCSPEERSIETAEYFGHPIILEALDAWFRGAYESLPGDHVKEAMRQLILNPDRKPPGVSPISGKPGETYNSFLRPLIIFAYHNKKHWKANERILSVTSGGNLQAVDHFAKAGFSTSFQHKDYVELAKKPYWSQTGQLFLETDHGLKKVGDNKDFGRYWIEHAMTAYNSQPPGSPTDVTAGVTKQKSQQTSA